MQDLKQNYYGRLCTQMYEILHSIAPQDELDFYLSYAQKDMKILEPLCGSGRFLVPFMERGFDIEGIDLSEQMLSELKKKSPHAKIVLSDILDYSSANKYDYIFISSGSVSLFTDLNQCQQILAKLKNLLSATGKLVFAVDSIGERCVDDNDYTTKVTVKTQEGFDLLLKTKNHYDEETQTQFSPSIYELYNGSELLQSELMDFQTHLYKFGQMEQLLKDIGFTNVKTYSTFAKDLAQDNQTNMFLFECTAN